MIDNFGRFIDTLRISVTDKCNLRCNYCIPLNENNFFEDKILLTFEEIIEVIKESVKYEIKNIKLTGGEPLLRKNIVELVKMISKIKEIKDISMTSNGSLLQYFAKPLKLAGLNRINISLDAINEKLYFDITNGGNLKDALNGIEESQKAGLTPIKINTVLIKGKNENEISQIKNFCLQNNLNFQLINQMKLNDKKENSENFGKTDKPPKCQQCNRIRLTADGKLLPCLFSNIEIDIKKYKSINEAIMDCIKCKPKIGQNGTTRVMNKIGG